MEKCDNSFTQNDDGGVAGLMKEEESVSVKTVGGNTCVRMLRLDFVRSKFVTHFVIANKGTK